MGYVVTQLSSLSNILLFSSLMITCYPFNTIDPKVSLSHPIAKIFYQAHLHSLIQNLSPELYDSDRLFTASKSNVSHLTGPHLNSVAIRRSNGFSQMKTLNSIRKPRNFATSLPENMITMLKKLETTKNSLRKNTIFC